MPHDSLDAESLIRLLQLEWLPPEGGYFRRTYCADESVDFRGGKRPVSTAIYYLVTPDQFSALHRLAQDEVFHFYRGDPVEMLHIHPDGRSEIVVIGPGIEHGQRPQALAPAGVWQGTRLRAGGRWALLGCTVSPGFDFADYEHGDRKALLAAYPELGSIIEGFTRDT
jgi:uncharacterized protein